MLGASWALTLLSAFYIFSLFIKYSLFVALVGAILTVMFGLMFIVLFEYILYRIHSQQKQLVLLEKIAHKLDSDSL